VLGVIPAVIQREALESHSVRWMDLLTHIEYPVVPHKRISSTTCCNPNKQYLVVVVSCPIVKNTVMGKKDDKKDDGGSSGTSNHVYVMDKDLAWVPAKLIERRDKEAVVSVPTYDEETAIFNDGGKGAKKWTEQVVKLKGYPGGELPMANVDKAGVLLEKEDMVDLPFLHEVRNALSQYNLRVIFSASDFSSTRVAHRFVRSICVCIYLQGCHSFQLERATQTVSSLHSYWGYCNCHQPLPMANGSLHRRNAIILLEKASVGSRRRRSAKGSQTSHLRDFVSFLQKSLRR